MVIELGDEYFKYSSDEQAKTVESFNSKFWNSGHVRQKSNLSFEESYKGRDLRKKQKVDCNFCDDGMNYDLFKEHARDIADIRGHSESEGSEEQEEMSEMSEMSEDEEVEDAASHGAHEPRRTPSVQFSLPNESFNDTLQIYPHNPPIGSDEEALFGDDKSYNKDMDNTAHVYLDDIFNLGAPEVGTPAMCFGEFMNLDIPDIHSEQIGMRRDDDGEPLMDINEL